MNRGAGDPATPWSGLTGLGWKRVREAEAGKVMGVKGFPRAVGTSGQDWTARLSSWGQSAQTLHTLEARDPTPSQAPAPMRKSHAVRMPTMPAHRGKNSTRNARLAGRVPT